MWITFAIGEEPFILFVRGFIPDFIDADTKKNSYKNYLHREMVL